MLSLEETQILKLDTSSLSNLEYLHIAGSNIVSINTVPLICLKWLFAQDSKLGTL